MAALGGATRACQLITSLLDRVLHEGDEAGLGVDVPLAELAVRALSQAALGEGRQAVLDAKGVRVLLDRQQCAGGHGGSRQKGGGKRP